LKQLFNYNELKQLVTTNNKLSMKYNSLASKNKSSSDRKARTRTLIQIGGLADKAGLLELLNIQTGEDLEEDIASLNKAALLLGFLIDAIDSARLDDKNKHKWFRLGLSVMKGRK
jgi:hypothetical protein